MSYAPASLSELAVYWQSKGGVSLGIVGDLAHQQRASYHNGADVIRRYGRTCATDYTICHPRDVAGLSNAASAIDLGKLDGSLTGLQRFTRWLGERVLANDPDTRDIRDVLGSPDGVTVVGWFSGQLRNDGRPEAQIGAADKSHLSHTHISFFRDSETRSKLPIFMRYFEGKEDMLAVVTRTPFPQPVAFTIPAGTTLHGYNAARPGGPVKSSTWAKESRARAAARVKVEWPDAPKPPIPHGYPFLEVLDGFYEGLLIVEAYVRLDPIPDPVTEARAAGRIEAIDAAIKALEALR